MLLAERDARVEAVLRVPRAQVFCGAVFARIAVDEPTTEVAASEEERWVAGSGCW